MGGNRMTDSERALLARVSTLLRREPQSVDLSAELRSTIGELVPFDRACWGLLDPVSHFLVTNNNAMPETTIALRAWESELTAPDVNSISELVRSPDHVGVLSIATGGQPERSHRYQTALAPMGATDELRAVLSVGGISWGWLALFRFHGSFGAAEAARVATLAPMLARSWRTALLGRPGPRESPVGPAMLVVDRSGRLESVTPGGQVLLNQLPPGQLGPTAAVVQALALSVRGQERPVPRATLRGTAGSWLVLEAAPLIGDGDRVAISITRAGGSELGAVLLGAYGLTTREIDVALGVLRHETSAQIAAGLYLSRWTVQDHLKSVYAKTGVRSRQDLAVQLSAGTIPT